MSKPIGWEVWEEIGIGIPNSRSCIRVPRPEGISDEEWEAFVVALEKADAEREAREKEEQERAIQQTIDEDTKGNKQA